jgi:hypothetical protein
MGTPDLGTPDGSRHMSLMRNPLSEQWEMEEMFFMRVFMLAKQILVSH